MAKIGNRVKETTDTTGTGTLDLNGAATGFRALSDEFASGVTVDYVVVDDPDNPTEYEYGQGTFTAGTPDTLSRDTVEGSSNSGNKVSFSAGTKTVIVSPLASTLTGGWQLLEEQEASSSSSLDFETGIDDEYDLYMLVLTDILPATDAAQPYLRISDDGGATHESGVSDYSHESVQSANGTVTGASGSAAQIPLSPNSGAGNLSDEGFSAKILMYSPATAGRKTSFNWLMELVASNGALRLVWGAGRYETAGATNGLQLLLSSGNIASGKAALYGLKR